MKKLLLPLLLLLPLILILVGSAPLFAAPAVVQCTTVAKPNNVTSSSANFSVLPTVGNKIKILSSMFTSGNISAHTVVVTDNHSNTFSTDSGADIVSTDTNHRNNISSGYVVTSTGTFTMSIRLSDSSLFVGTWEACEVSGLTATLSFDQKGTTEVLSNTSITVTGAAPNCVASEIIFAIMYNNGGGSGANTPSGFTQLFLDTTNIGAAADYKVLSGVETSSVTWTYTSGNSLGVLTTDKGTACGTSTRHRAMPTANQ